MFIILSFIIMIILFCLGIPVAFSIAIISAAYLIFNQIPMTTLIQRMISGTDSFPLMAAPLFVLAALIMSYGGTTKRLVGLSNSLVGHLTGGMGHVNVIASMIFAGMSGSATADAAGLGTIELKMMADAGYDKRFSAAITAASSVIGPIVPPSVPFVIYGAFAQVSVGRLFLGGAIPGVFMGLYLMAVVYWIAKKRNFPKGDSFSFIRLIHGFRDSVFELFTPLIIMGGIVSGIFTPTEAAVVAVAYALFLEIVIRREITLKMLRQILTEACKFTGIIFFIIASASTYRWVLMRERAGIAMVNALKSLTTNPIILLLLILVGLIIIGCFIETIACIIISVPVLEPMAAYLGIDPVHFGVIVILAIMIGLITPPVGLCMYIMCSIADVNLVEFSHNVFPMFIALLLVLLTIAFFPSITLFLPNLIMGQ